MNSVLIVLKSFPLVMRIGNGVLEKLRGGLSVELAMSLPEHFLGCAFTFIVKKFISVANIRVSAGILPLVDDEQKGQQEGKPGEIRRRLFQRR